MSGKSVAPGAWSDPQPGNAQVIHCRIIRCELGWSIAPLARYAGLVPGIHIVHSVARQWMAGPSPRRRVFGPVGWDKLGHGDAERTCQPTNSCKRVSNPGPLCSLRREASLFDRRLLPVRITSGRSWTDFAGDQIHFTFGQRLLQRPALIQQARFAFAESE